LSSPQTRAKHEGVQGLSMHCALPAQTCPVGQDPQVPLQPSEPHWRPVQSGVHTQMPTRHSHWYVAVQDPQEPPQPSSPQSLPEHWGAQVHLPAVEQVSVAEQVPQDPPQPSLPQFLLVQFGTQGQARGWVPVGSEVFWVGPQVYWVVEAVQ